MNSQHRSKLDVKALIVQHGFPTNGGSRVEKIVRYLPVFGVEPIVLSANHSDTRRRSEILQSYFSPSLRTYQAPLKGWEYFHSRYHCRGPDAKYYTLLKLLSFPERCAYVPDQMVRWIKRGKLLAKDIASCQGLDCVFTSSPYESSHLIGLYLKEELGIPWIADFRDMWTGKSIAYRPATPIHDRWIRSLERKIMNKADYVIANTVENRDTYLRDFDLPPAKVYAIPNGFDRHDVDLAAPKRFAVKKFRIGYMGSLTKSSFPWRLFLDALAILAEEEGDENVEFVFCGEYTNEVVEYVQDRKIESIFSYHGLLTHSEAVQLMSNTDAQLVLLYENEDSHTIVPQKLYNYMAVDGPIIAIAPENGATARVIEETKCGKVVAARRGVRAVYEILRSYFDDWKAGELSVTLDEAATSRYDRERQTGVIADLMKDLSRR